MTVTLNDIAQKANVSIATVSRVLNEYPHVNEDTRALVMRVVEELNYPIEKIRRPVNPNRSIVVMGTGRDQTPDESGNVLRSDKDFTNLILAGTEKVLADTDIVPRIQHAWRYPEDAYKEALSMTDDPSIDGVILLGGGLNESFLQGIKETGFPCVIAGAHYQDFEIDSVMADYLSGIDQIFSHLLESGRRRIALVNGLPTSRTSEIRYKAYRLSLALRGIGYESKAYIPGKSEYSVNEGEKQTNLLLDQNPDIDAIIYHDDYRAMGGLRALQSRGIKVPDDIAIVGFHDYELAQYATPQMTTVHVRMRLMGEVAARRLCSLIEDPEQQAWYITIPTYLVIREST